MTLPILPRFANLACVLPQYCRIHGECRNGSIMRDRQRQIPSLEGQLLVASPYMVNSFFARTVVLMLQDADTGSMGVILNRPLGVASRSVWEQLSSSVDNDRPVYFGGPLPGPLVAVHQEKEVAEMSLGHGLFLAADRSHLDWLVEHDDRPFRVFVGHAGWGRGQLQRELKQGAWMLLPGSRDQVFADEEDVWTKAVRAVGRSVLKVCVDPRRVPGDVLQN